MLRSAQRPTRCDWSALLPASATHTINTVLSLLSIHELRNIIYYSFSEQKQHKHKWQGHIRYQVYICIGIGKHHLAGKIKTKLSLRDSRKQSPTPTTNLRQEGRHNPPSPPSTLSGSGPHLVVMVMQSSNPLTTAMTSMILLGSIASISFSFTNEYLKRARQAEGRVGATNGQHGHDQSTPSSERCALGETVTPLHR